MLVSAIMPTRGRPDFARRSLECFMQQNYWPRELVIVDDADCPSFDSDPSGVWLKSTQAVMDDFEFPSPHGARAANIIYQRIRTRYTIGSKRNIACSRASGDVIMHWDDDDWSAPGRMADQMDRILSGAQLTGYHSMIFEDVDTGKRWKYRGASCYALGTSLCYTREFWSHRPFEDRNEGEDNAFIQKRNPLCVDAGQLMIARIHSSNTSPKRDGLKHDCYREVFA